VLRWALVLTGLRWTVRLVMLPVVVRRKSQPPVCLAWLSIIFLAPFLGVSSYLLFGEVRLGARRIRRHAREVDVVARADRPEILEGHVVQPGIEQAGGTLLHVADQLGGLPVLGGNSTELLTDSGRVIDRLVQDIDQATHHIHLLFYIFAGDEVGGRVAQAMVRARARGVRCRLLADAVGSRRFLRTRAPQLTRRGVEVVPALPVNPLRRLFARIDVRNHRKLAVIDGRVAYTGSQNIVRPDYGKEGVGQWRDLMVRVVGPSVGQLQSVFLEDWEFETDQVLDDPEYFPAPEARGEVALQVVPSGPNHPTRILRDLAVEALHSARSHAAIITPYFIPDEALLVALRLAVVRGVRVELIVPARSDQILVGLAGRYFADEVLRQGVHVHLYQRGLIHVKAMIVDEGFGMLGTANFDIRSFYLNFELNLLAYDEELNGQLRSYRSACIEESIELDPDAWERGGILQRWGPEFAKLFSPLL
jgi:cardiolipin synthase A/B